MNRRELLERFKSRHALGFLEVNWLLQECERLEMELKSALQVKERVELEMSKLRQEMDQIFGERGKV